MKGIESKKVRVIIKETLIEYCKYQVAFIFKLLLTCLVTLKRHSYSLPQQSRCLKICTPHHQHIIVKTICIDYYSFTGVG